MSCRNLELVITELARGQMLEARVKEDALAHMDGCQRCAARFANEQTLTAGLRAVSASASSVEAPGGVEQSLLAAFRQRQVGGVPAAFIAPAPVHKPRWIPLSIAAAAAILVVSVLASQLIPSGNSNAPLSNQARVSQPAPVPAEDSDPLGLGDEPEVAAGGPEQRADDVQPPLRSVNRRRDLVRNDGPNRGRMQNAVNYGTASNSESELTTDFLPLTYGSNLAQIEDGQVVRVELPRSALQSFGFHVSAERAGERVKADVLLGHDGVARAIRFVR
ncbi:MAG TPA: hypothetical protein VJT09_18585 [Pyrinomonadaceae bacterium]|nr:hypothetical protein [Pyrinomonadaceae bacterium]